VNEAVQTFTLVLLGLFGVGGVLIAIASAFSRTPKKLLTLYGLELAQVGAIVGPALLGSPWIELGYALLAAACAFELGQCLQRSGVKTFAAFASAISVACVSFGALIVLARAHVAALLFCYVIIELNDTAAWALGSALGKKRVWPALSPNKTWVGLAAGAGVCCTFPLVLRFLLPSLTTGVLVLSGLGLFVLGTLGDGLASYAKRRAGLRVFSDLIPHQGGVLDLYDSLVFAAPFWLGFCALL
jgi:predicted CDP-diglyceride synthetase/phosphatidate cytidylyltransferase